MLTVLASLVIAGAGAAAILVIILTVQAQSAAVRQVIADSRAIARDREFLVCLINESVGVAGPNAPLDADRLRPALLPQWTFSRRSDAARLQPALLCEAA
ncbi:hypothetical protein [Novosphingobium sp. Chol11]|uniref:hypothetical protein n=1 Tax=Novosphingobium sp. Chol11 TaxID=1385763 RepID=UPI0025F102AC|nr:hypothetical protein [Novosphingobium sp. Chol11]